MSQIPIPADLVVKHRNIRSTVIESSHTSYATHQRILKTSQSMLSLSHSHSNSRPTTQLSQQCDDNGDDNDNSIHYSGSSTTSQFSHATSTHVTQDMLSFSQGSSSSEMEDPHTHLIPITRHEKLRYYHPSQYIKPHNTPHASPPPFPSSQEAVSPSLSSSEIQHTWKDGLAPQTTCKPNNNSLYSLISHLQLQKSITKRRRLKIMSFLHAINAIQEAKRIVVVAGAGISVSSGIPDFRSANGLYALLKDADLASIAVSSSQPSSQSPLTSSSPPERSTSLPISIPPLQLHASSPSSFISSSQPTIPMTQPETPPNSQPDLPYDQQPTPSNFYPKPTPPEPFTPQDLFNLPYFLKNPIPFYTFYYQMMRMMSPTDDYTSDEYPLKRIEPLYKPTPAHRFIKLIEDQGKLLRCYTQNIDGLEKAAGIKRYVACHGNDDEFYCTQCKTHLPRGVFMPFIRDKTIPYCQEVRKVYEYWKNTHGEMGHPLSTTTSSPVFPDDHCNGIWKPTIVFFGEPLPPSFVECLKQDMGQADLILVMGTSLQVAPISMIPFRLSFCRGKIRPPIPPPSSQSSPHQSTNTTTTTNQDPNGNEECESGGNTANSNHILPDSSTTCIGSSSESYEQQQWKYRVERRRHKRMLKMAPIESSLDFISRTFANVPIFSINKDRIPCLDLDSGDDDDDDVDGGVMDDYIDDDNTWGGNGFNKRLHPPPHVSNSNIVPNHTSLPDGANSNALINANNYHHHQNNDNDDDVIQNRFDLEQQMKKYSLESEEDSSDDDDDDNGDGNTITMTDYDAYLTTPLSRNLKTMSSSHYHIQSSSFNTTYSNSIHTTSSSSSYSSLSSSSSSIYGSRHSPQRTYSLKHPQLFDYEFIGNADDVCQLMCAILDWPNLLK